MANPTICISSDSKLRIYKLCSITGKEYSVKVDHAAYVRWTKREAPVQEIFPDLSAEEREFLVSGLTPAEWAEVVGSCEEEEESE